MKFINIKYVIIICVALTLFFKVSNVLSYLKFSTSTTEYTILGDDAEKEEKKVENEYFDNQIIFDSLINTFSIVEKKLIIPDNFSITAYFPEVLTPPPSI
ncbi:hypothetical protein QWY86_14975 [Pedobacter aquatilis]|uniref:hypothetical protein n=1 Tax=Pedobacter aquatilis TaxID=351343 RepID=UPI0025B472D2|nr:hypothetical protein [Pedobacter aquatilis]MDN3587983.1 hypothetical protein [Pedobacter aquatilis]